MKNKYDPKNLFRMNQNVKPSIQTMRVSGDSKTKQIQGRWNL